MAKKNLLFSAVMVVALVAAGCGPAATPTPTVEVAVTETVSATPTGQPISTPVVATEPEYGGTIRVSMVADPPSLGDPPPSWDSGSWTCHLLLYNGLLRFKQNSMEVEPELAEALPTVSADGMTFTFTLREGLKFSSGRALTADDVKYTLDRMLDDETQGWGTGYYMMIKGAHEAFTGEAEGVEGIRVIDERTIEIETTEAIAPEWFMALMATPWTYVVDKEAVEQWGAEFRNHPAGSGPYTLESYTPGQLAVFTKNTNFWRYPEEPYADRIEMQLGVDTSLGAMKLENGEIDLVTDAMSPAARKPFLEDPAWQPYIKQAMKSGSEFMAFDASQGLTADIRVRQAIAYAIDKEKIVEVLGGNGEVANAILSPTAGEWYDATIPQYEYDPEKAEALLEEAGVEGETLEFWTANYYPWAELGQAVQADLLAVGLNVDLHMVRRAAWYQANANHNPIVFNHTPLELPDPAYSFEGSFACAAMYPDSCCNFSWWCTPEMEAELAAARTERDHATRVTLYQALDREVVYERALFIPLIYTVDIWVHSPRLGGFEIPVVLSPASQQLARLWVVGGGE